MRFEGKATILCAQALAADNDKDAHRILAELRFVLHQHIEQLRSGLMIAYWNRILPAAGDDANEPETFDAIEMPSPMGPSRTWQQLVHELACEKDHARALQLSHELAYLLQRRAVT
jgi:hypothetical protein